MRTVAFDTETLYVKPTTKDPGYSVAKMGNWRYTHDPRFDCYLISVYDGEEAWAGHPRDFNWDALDGAHLISHNAAFDTSVYEAMVETGVAPRISPAAWDCSANLTSFLCNRRSLAEATEYLLRVKVSKGMRDWMNGRTWADAVAEGKDKELLKYATDDVVHCWNIFNRYSGDSVWQSREKYLSRLTMKQCARGVAIDTKKLERYRDVLRQVLHEIEQSLPWVKDGAKVTSTKAINAECRKVGILTPPIKSHDGGEEAFVVWEETFGPRFSWVAKVGQWRSINKVLTTLDTIRERLRPDGTIDFSLLFFGGHTGRWSGGGSGLNMQNLRKDPIYIRDDYSVDEAGTEASYRETIDIRSLFIPRPGHQFVISDLSQIEPRVLRWCAGDLEFLNMVRQGYSPYEAAARTSPSIKWAGGDLKKEDKYLYQRVKINELGLGYGCGATKFVSLAKTLGGIDLTPEQSQAEVDQWRASNPKIVKLWNTLDNRFKGSLGKTFEVELPSGRTMRYPRVLQEYKMYLDADKKWQRKQVFTADIGGKRKSLYGGLLTENLVQATARDVFAEHLLALDRAGINTVFTVHDEAVTEVPTGTDPREVESIMSVTPEWLEGCPVAAEAQVAPHYLK